MTSLSQLQKWQSVLDGSLSPADKDVVIDTIEAALTVAPPDGSPDAISDKGNDYIRAGSTCTNASIDLDDVARNKLPAAWRGNAAETASQAVSGLNAEAAGAGSVLSQAGQALVSWADNLRNAQRDDSFGRDAMQSALSRLHPSGGYIDFQTAVSDARTGIAAMADAANTAQLAGQNTAAVLNQLADQARAERVDGSGLDPLDTVVLATETNALSDGGGDILTAAELTRASDLMNGMSPAELAEFEKLLADAQSPEEAAFLMKALAAGNSVAAVEQFDALIHPYGNNPIWLSQHLAPDLTDDTYGGVASIDGWPVYAQRNIGDCVSASTVAALANLDPVFMLKLTTGDTPGLPGSDSPQAFVNRLQAAYISQYQQGQHADGDPGGYPQVDGGLGLAGGNSITNSYLGTASGTSYHYVSLNGTGDNQTVLPAVEQAVDSGQPVPLGVTTPGGGLHQVMIIGASGNSLEIYNPWGSTSWVTTQQFASDQLGSVIPGKIASTTGIRLPSS